MPILNIYYMDCSFHMFGVENSSLVITTIVVTNWLVGLVIYGRLHQRSEATFENKISLATSRIEPVNLTKGVYKEGRGGQPPRN